MVDTITETHDTPPPVPASAKAEIKERNESLGPKPGSYAEKLLLESRQEERKNKLKSIPRMPKKDDIKVGGTTSDEPQPEVVELGTEAFDKEQLEVVWAAFGRRLEEEGANDSHRMVMKQPYRLEGEEVIITLSNAFQQDILGRFHLELVTFLRKSLNNYRIEVRSEITHEEREDMIYTNREKFEHMVKSNPSLKALKDLMELDPEF